MSSVDIILPAFNPSSNWTSNLINACNELQSQIGYSMNIILVDDGSTVSLEKGFDQVKTHFENAVFLRHPQNLGKGAAIKTGLKHSKSDIIIYTDVDFPYAVSSVVSLLKSLSSKDMDLLVGIRNTQYSGRLTLQRRLISGLLKLLNRTLLKLKVSDTQAGLKGLNARGRSLALDVKSNRYLFDLELVKLASIEPHFKVETETIELREGIKIPPMPLKTLMGEIFDLIRILFR